MSTQGASAADEILDLVEALAEHLDWQDACGGYGLPRSTVARDAEPAQAKPARLEQVAGPVRQLPSVVAADDVLDQELPAQRPQVVPDLPAVAARPERAAKETRQAPSPPKPASVLSDQQRRERLQVLAQEVAGCTRCALHAQRKQAVFGVGRPGVDIMIVGEGPGADEDEQGEPFVGKAGQLLDKMLAAMGYARGDVYIANVVKCRPPGNRNPEPEETSACLPYLHEQIELVAPRVILAMGTTAVRALLGASGIMRVRGKWKLYRARIPVMPTFHPAYLLRNDAAKRDAWADLKAVMGALGREVPKKTPR